MSIKADTPSLGAIVAQVGELAKFYTIQTYASVTGLSFTWPVIWKVGVLGAACYGITMGVHLIRLHVKMETKTA